MLERCPQIDTVHFALDNDQAGQLATRRLAKLAREKGLAVNALVPVLKDWNDGLKHQQIAAGTGPVEGIAEVAALRRHAEGLAYGMNYQEAVLALLDKDVSELCPQVTAPREKVKKPFELPPDVGH
jgi:DNA primase